MDWRDPEMVQFRAFRHAISTSRGSSCCAVELTMQPIQSCLAFQGQPGHRLKVSPEGSFRKGSIFRSDLPKDLQISTVNSSGLKLPFGPSAIPAHAAELRHQLVRAPGRASWSAQPPLLARKLNMLF